MDIAGEFACGVASDVGDRVAIEAALSSRRRSTGGGGQLTEEEICNGYLMCWGCLGNRICCEPIENNWQTGVCCCCASLDVNGLADACCCALTLCSPCASYLPLMVRLDWECSEHRGLEWLGCLCPCGPCAMCNELLMDRFELSDFPPKYGAYGLRNLVRQGMTWVRDTPDGWTLINSGQILKAQMCAWGSVDICVVGCCVPCWPSLAGSQMHREARLRGIIRHHWAMLACARLICCAAAPQQVLIDEYGWPQLTPFDSEYEGTCCSFFRGKSTVLPEPQEPVHPTTPAVTNIKTRFPTLSHKLIQHALDGFDQDEGIMSGVSWPKKAVDWLERTLELTVDVSLGGVQWESEWGLGFRASPAYLGEVKITQVDTVVDLCEQVLPLLNKKKDRYRSDDVRFRKELGLDKANMDVMDSDKALELDGFRISFQGLDLDQPLKALAEIGMMRGGDYQVEVVLVSSLSPATIDGP